MLHVRLDNVVHIADMELMVCPVHHTRNGLSYDDVINTVLDGLKQVTSTKFTVGVVLYVSTTSERTWVKWSN